MIFLREVKLKPQMQDVKMLDKSNIKPKTGGDLMRAKVAKAMTKDVAVRNRDVLNEGKIRVETTDGEILTVAELKAQGKQPKKNVIPTNQKAAVKAPKAIVKGTAANAPIPSTSGTIAKNKSYADKTQKNVAQKQRLKAPTLESQSKYANTKFTVDKATADKLRNFKRTENVPPVSNDAGGSAYITLIVYMLKKPFRCHSRIQAYVFFFHL